MSGTLNRTYTPPTEGSFDPLTVGITGALPAFYTYGPATPVAPPPAGGGLDTFQPSDGGAGGSQGVGGLGDGGVNMGGQMTGGIDLGPNPGNLGPIGTLDFGNFSGRGALRGGMGGLSFGGLPGALVGAVLGGAYTSPPPDKLANITLNPDMYAGLLEAVQEEMEREAMARGLQSPAAGTGSYGFGADPTTGDTGDYGAASAAERGETVGPSGDYNMKEGGLVGFQEGGYISDEEYDRRLLSRMKRDTGRVTEPTPAEQREAFGQAAREAGQMAADVLLPQSPLDAALMVALGPGGRAARMAGAGALAALEPSEAEAGIVRRAAEAARGLPSTEGFRPVYPQPQRAMPQGEQIPGGRYLENPARNPETGQMEGIDITGQTRQGTRIEIGPDGSPLMTVAPGATEKAGAASGNVVRTNLFRREAGWNWIGNPPPGISEDARFLISVQPKTNQHIYALATDFEGPATMARYPRAANEPRLRPTTRGDVELGNVVGRIDVRGREHPVYDHVYIFNREPKAPSPSRSRRRGTLGIQPAEEPEAFAEGGLVPLAGGGKVAVGPGGGLDDLIPTSINGRQAAALSDGEFVIPADVVSMMGDGSSNAGARRLYDLVRQVRDNKTGTTRQAGPLPVGDILKRSLGE